MMGDDLRPTRAVYGVTMSAHAGVFIRNWAVLATPARTRTRVIACTAAGITEQGRRWEDAGAN